MRTGLEDRVVLITGAGAGIGRATVEAFLAEGARVLAADLDTSPLATDLDTALSAERLVRFTVDLGEPDGPPAAVAETVRRFGQIDVLVNNVGIATMRDGFLDVSDEDWLALININFLSMVRATRAALPHMLARASGVIVSLASDAGHEPGIYFPHYSVSKVAVRMLSKELATEFGSRGIRSNSVSPGPTRTPAFESASFLASIAERHGLDSEGAIELFLRDVRRMPLGRLGAAADVAALIVFLSSDLARQVTGADYRVDGGAIATI
jgi:NAD(P)-dependent dehydrogenase (short-subunit alcohol dehydrogenase family)